MHSICLVLWFQEHTHQAASSGDVPNDHNTERSSFCSAFVSADETTLGKSLTKVCRLWQRDLSFLSSFRVIAPQATAASPENVWMHHRNICWECWMHVLVDSNLSFLSRLVDILMKKTLARMAYLLAVSPTMYNYSVGISKRNSESYPAEGCEGRTPCHRPLRRGPGKQRRVKFSRDNPCCKLILHNSQLPSFTTCHDPKQDSRCQKDPKSFNYPISLQFDLCLLSIATGTVL